MLMVNKKVTAYPGTSMCVYFIGKIFVFNKVIYLA
jgi:hypothetical protein